MNHIVQLLCGNIAVQFIASQMSLPAGGSSVTWLFLRRQAYTIETADRMQISSLDFATTMYVRDIVVMKYSYLVS